MNTLYHYNILTFKDWLNVNDCGEPVSFTFLSITNGVRAPDLIQDGENTETERRCIEAIRKVKRENPEIWTYEDLKDAVKDVLTSVGYEIISNFSSDDVGY